MDAMNQKMEMNMNMPAMPRTMRMLKRKWVMISLGAVLLVVGWALFRPELLFINQTVNEALPSVSPMSRLAPTEPVALASGNFHGVAHETKGMANVLQLADGSRVVRLTDFETSNGPDVHLFLVAAMDASDSESVKKAGYVDLGSLKGNIGDQNYEIPADLDLGKYRAVTVWCARFGVNFGTAPLKMGQ